jgi:putative transcriptional regulator
MEFCEACCEESLKLEADAAGEWIDSTSNLSPVDSPQFEDMLSNISEVPQFNGYEELQEHRTVCCELSLDERQVKIPAVLAKVADQGVNWKPLSGGINTAGLSVCNSAKCDFMYMKPGSQAPRHTHRGFEITLVLDGNFSDELGSYRPGDFIFRLGKDIHTPKTEEGCLCFSVLDNPLTFTSGLSRLLNPIQRFTFSRG